MKITLGIYHIFNPKRKTIEITIKAERQNINFIGKTSKYTQHEGFGKYEQEWEIYGLGYDYLRVGSILLVSMIIAIFLGYYLAVNRRLN